MVNLINSLPLRSESYITYIADNHPEPEDFKRRIKIVNEQFSRANKLLNSVNLSEREEGYSILSECFIQLSKLDRENSLYPKTMDVKDAELYKKDISIAVVGVLKSIFKRGNEPEKLDWGFRYHTIKCGNTQSSIYYPSKDSILAIAKKENLEGFLEWIEERCPK